MKRITWKLGFILLAVHAATTGLSAQDTVAVSGEVTCSACVITFDTVATIGGLDGPGLHQISFYSVVAVDRRGRIHIAEQRGAARDLGVRCHGRVPSDSWGSRRRPRRVQETSAHIDIGPEYIHVFDWRRGRTLLDHDFNVVEVHRFPAVVVETFVTDSDEVVWVGDVPTSASVGHRIHISWPHRRDTLFWR